MTDSTGSYQFVNLIPGQYQLAIEKSGFKRKVLAGMQVVVQQTVRADAALDVGAVTETVEVTTQAALLQTEQSSLSQAVEGRTVQEMPLNGRNVMNLVGLVPGVVPQGGTSGSPVGGANGNSTNVNSWGNYQIGGGAANQSAMFFDGAPLNTSYVNSVALVPTQDAVQEFRVATNSVSPEFGRFAGGVVNLASKSGTNSFHGALYEYVRNTKLNASNFFATSKPAFHQNQFGASLSGPIKKDKTFFMGTWEKFSVRVGVPTTTTVPTAAMKSGDFSTLLGAATGGTNPCDGTPVLKGAIYDPLTTQTIGGTPCRKAFAGNIIPSARFDPTAVVMAGLLGAPTVQNSILNNFVKNGTGGGDTNQYNGRVDHALNDQQRLFGRYTYWKGNTVPNDLFNNLATATMTKYSTHSVALGYTWTINPTTVADIRLSYLRFVSGIYPLNTGADLSKFGPAFGALQSQVIFPQFPASQVSGMQTFNYVTARNTSNNEVLTENITKILGRHTLKIGGESRKIEWGYGQDNYSSGQFTFTTAFTALNPQSPTGSGYAFASMLLGYPATGIIQEILIAKQQMWYHGAYLSDTFQMTPKLTLNLGIRWEFPGQFREAHDSAAVFLPEATDPFGSTVGLPLKGLATMVNTSAYPNRDMHPAKWNAVAPRVGFAYRLTDTSVIRAGYGISYLPNDSIFGNAPWDTPPNMASTSMNTSGDGGLHPADVLSNPFPGGIVQPSRHITNLEPSIVGTVIQLPIPNQPTPYAQQWNLAIQQQFPGNTALEIGYAGSKGTHLPLNAFVRGFPYFEKNQIADSYLSQRSALLTQVPNPFYGKVPSTAGILTKPTIAAGQLLRPYPQFSSVNNTSELTGATVWHALMAKVEKRLGGGGMLLGTYTWSKLIGNADSQTGWLDASGTGRVGAITNYNNPAGERSLSSFDVPHRATISYVLDLPFGRGKHFGGNVPKALDVVIGGWGINGTTTIQKGFPILLGVATATTVASTFGGGGARPNVVPGCDKNVTGSAYSRVTKWFNTACFTQPDAFGFGNESRVDSILRSQGVANWDIALSKNFKITERYRLKFNSEFFNLFNRVQFDAPNSSTGDPNFGRITTVRNQPRLIQLALRLSF